MRKLLYAGAVALSAIGGMATADAASASVYPPDTTVVDGLPPGPTSTTRPPVTVATTIPVAPTQPTRPAEPTQPTRPAEPTQPPALPTTGGSTAVALQVGAAALVAGTGVVLAARRRRPAAV